MLLKKVSVKTREDQTSTSKPEEVKKLVLKKELN